MAALRRLETVKTAHPKRATVARMAIVLATDPYTCELDELLARRIADDLRQAVGSGCPGPPPSCWTRAGGWCAKYRSP